MEKLQLKEIADRAESLRKKVIDKLSELDIPTDSIPKSMQPQDGPIKLVFVGQYSAGKSSLIQMLTEIKIKTGGGITTQEASVYPWGSLEIIDTPGIDTGLHEDHDKITYEEMDKAALLVFVITPEGFNDQIGRHFRKLAIEQHRGDHMILVVTKMDRAPKKNSKEQQEVLREDLKKVIQPLSHEQLYTSFVSADYYNDAMEETDEEIKNELLLDSGYAELVDNINAFVKEKGVTAKLAQPLYDLNHFLADIGADEKSFESLDKKEELCKRTKRVYDTEKEDALQAIQNEMMDMQSELVNIGVQTANDIVGSGMSESDARQELESASGKAAASVNTCAARVEKILETMVKNAGLGLDEIGHSSLAKDVLQTDLPQGWMDDGEKSANYSELADRLSKAGNFIVNRALKDGATKVFGSNLGSFSRTGVHEGILTVGKVFGFKFKPWQAVKMTKNVAVFGKVLGAAGLIYQIYQMFQSKEEEEKQQRAMDEARSEIKSQFKEWADKAYGEIAQQAREQVSAIMDAPQEALADSLASIDEAREKMEAVQPTVQGLQNEVYAMLNELEECRE